MFTRIFNCSRNLVNYSLQHRVIVSRLLHNTKVLSYKRFDQNETDFSSKFITKHDFSKYFHECQQKPEFNENLLIASMVEKSNDELIQILEVIAEHCHEVEDSITNVKYDEIVKQIVERISNFSDDELVRILLTLAKIPPTPDPLTRNYADLWQAVDAECVNRIHLWPAPFLMKICSLWNKIHLGKVGQFTRVALKKSTRYVRNFSPSEIVEMMFYINVCRKRMEEMIEVELHIIKHFRHFSIQELGIISIAFFKSQTKTKSFELITNIYEALLKNLDNVGDITLAGILKNLRYCSDFTHLPQMERLCEGLSQRTEKFSLMCCLHMALLGTNLQVCNQVLMENIVQRFTGNIKEVRLKDIERLSLAMGLFNFQCRDGSERILLQKMVEEMKLRVAEYGQHPKCLSACTHYLTLCGVYDVDIIGSVLTEKYIRFAYGKLISYFENKFLKFNLPTGKNHFAVGREVLCLDSYAKINLKDIYKGPTLSDKMRRNITKFQSCYIPCRKQKWKLTLSDKLTLEMKEEIDIQYGDSKLTHVLPHYQMPDIIMCVDKDGKSVTDKILDCFPPDYSGNILSKEYLLSQKPEFRDNMNDYKMVSVVIGGWNLFVRNSLKPSGGLAMKIEQLKMIGYEPVVMFWADWTKKSINERNRIFHEKLRIVMQSSTEK